jgi:copper(I)-binding protein
MSRSLSLPSILLLLVTTVAAAVLSACDSSGGELEVLNARSRMSPMLTGVGAVYLDIRNATGQDEQLLGASVAPSVAGRVELHETFDADADHGRMDEGGMGDGMADDGMADDGMADDGMGDDMTDDMTDDGAMDGSHDMEGTTTVPTPDGFAMMGMREIEALDVPTGETVSLQPGGHHLMLLELADDLVPGATFELTLQFAATGELTVTVEVLEDV